MENVSRKDLISTVIGGIFVLFFVLGLFMSNDCYWSTHDERNTEIIGTIIDISSPPRRHGALVLSVVNQKDTIRLTVSNSEYDFWLTVPKNAYVTKRLGSLVYYLTLPNGNKIIHEHMCHD